MKNTVTGWDIETKTSLFKFQLAPIDGGRIGSLAFSPDVRRFAFGSFDPQVRVCDANMGNVVLPLRPGVRGPAADSVAFSPDGKRIAGSSLGKDRIWDAETGAELLSISRNEGWRGISNLTFSPDGTRIAVAQADDFSHTCEIQVWDASKGVELLTIEGDKNQVVSVAFSPDGKLLASSSKDNSIRLWHAENGAQLRRFNVSAGDKDKARYWDMRMSFIPNGKRLAGSERSEHSKICIWDVSEVVPQPVVPHQIIKRETKPASDAPRAEDARDPDGRHQARELLGGNNVVRPKGLNMVSRAEPTMRVKS